MKFRLLPFLVAGLSSLAFAGFARPAFAHPLDVAYLDLGKTSSTLQFTVAIHPYQAYEIVRGGSKTPFSLKELQKGAELVGAYVEDHVAVLRDGKVCGWLPGTTVPATELEALGDGVTVSGPLDCPPETSRVQVQADLFVANFPTQTNVVRLEVPGNYLEQATLDRDRQRVFVDLAKLSSTYSSGAEEGAAARNPDARVADLVKRLLEPGVGGFAFFGLLFSAIFLGALHALGPGHGKSLMAAMLVGEKATVKNVLALGTVMTVTHVADVFLLALFAGFISTFLPPVQLIFWLQRLSAVGLVLFGLYNLVRAIIRYRQIRANPEAGEGDEAHERAHLLGLPHAHGAAEAETHDHGLPTERDVSFRRVLWLGFVGSLAPCPTAWTIFLATISVGRAGTGFALLVAFTIGLHATILLIGFLLVVSKKYALKRTPPAFTYALPILSAGVVILLGTYLLWRSV